MAERGFRGAPGLIAPIRPPGGTKFEFWGARRRAWAWPALDLRRALVLKGASNAQSTRCYANGPNRRPPPLAAGGALRRPERAVATLKLEKSVVRRPIWISFAAEGVRKAHKSSDHMGHAPHDAESAATLPQAPSNPLSDSIPLTGTQSSVTGLSR